jgi:two-component system invasion response regulator UvrY
MTETSSKFTVFCVDDQRIICSTLAGVLNARTDFQCVGTALSPSEAIDEMIRLRPQIAIVDLLYVQDSGFKLLDQMRLLVHETRAVVYSALDDATCARRCLQLGALGYVSKQESVDVLLQAIVEVSQGKTVVSPHVANLVLRNYAASPEGLGDSVERLSTGELSVFLMLGQAMSTNEIARRLCKSPKTIDALKRQTRHSTS